MGILQAARRVWFIDWTIKTAEAWWAFAEQWGWAASIVWGAKLAGGALMGGWTWASVGSLPLGIACAIVVTAALNWWLAGNERRAIARMAAENTSSVGAVIKPSVDIISPNNDRKQYDLLLNHTTYLLSRVLLLNELKNIRVLAPATTRSITDLERETDDSLKTRAPKAIEYSRRIYRAVPVIEQGGMNTFAITAKGQASEQLDEIDIPKHLKLSLVSDAVVAEFQLDGILYGLDKVIEEIEDQLSSGRSRLDEMRRNL